MKKKYLRTLVAVAALLTTVFLTGCSDKKAEITESQATFESVAEAADTTSTARTSSKLSKYDFPKGRLAIIAKWDNFPDCMSTSYIIQDVSTDECYWFVSREDIRGGCSITPLLDSDGTALNLGQ